ncbi:MAG: hypothetical protein IJ909_10590 [Fibrobacter sp.]|nr:hypothetical protein [Fibrobacter sp.]
MKKRFLALGLAAGLTALMTACGDETTNTDIIKASSADNVDSLPKCDNSYEGMLATIPSKGQILVCNKGSWQNVAKTIQTSTDSSGNSNNESGCTAKTLEDKSGVTIICSGEKIATLKNGEKGPEGNPGKQGGQGDQGDPGSNGTGSSGSDLKLDETDCSVTYMGYDVTLYKCGNEEYFENLKGYTADLKTWNSLNMEAAIKNKAGTDLTSYLLLASLGSSKAYGQFLWNGDSVWTETDDNITTDRLKKDFAIRAQAKLKVESEAPPSYYVVLEPMVGMEMILKNPTNAYPLGGFCLTYEAEQKMELVVLGKSKVARVPLNASGKATTVNILPTDFKADSADAKVTDILSSINVIFIKAVGSLEEGEYENEFAIYEFGAYGRCSGDTYEAIKSELSSLKKSSSPLVDTRDGMNESYNTVKIGDQVWMAENLRKLYPFKSDDGDGDPETDNGDPMMLCPATEEEMAAKGCLYSWAAAMDSAGRLNQLQSTDPGYNVCGNGKICTATSPVQGICPNGWHLPSKTEVDVLLSNFGSYLEKYPIITARALAGDPASGFNWLGFSANATGWTSDLETIVDNATADYFYMWTSEDEDATYAHGLGRDNIKAYSSSFTKTSGRAIRCIQDKAK